ncbi:MAG: MBL fold metallo-hydrolase [Acidobacteriia bacterium]|nr:MBL fold metallo-hydrolase [Terriglobia bacterium]
MPKWTRRVLAVLFAIALGYYWLAVESHVPSGHYSIDIAELRRLANSIPGPKPREIRVERVATFQFPAAAIMAGGSWKVEDGPAVSYQIVYPDRTVIVDTAMDQATTKAMGRATFDPQAFAHMIQAMSSASLILVTHEHPDHIGGIATFSEAQRLTPSVRLTREQAAHPEQAAPAKMTQGVFQILNYERATAIAPGIALIKSPGHTPGSQMVFIQREDGAEFLLLGDVAWGMRNVENVRERPRFITTFMLHEDRDAVMLELAELHRLIEAEPKIHMLAGHDAAPIDALEKQGLLIEGFM